MTSERPGSPDPCSNRRDYAVARSRRRHRAVHATTANRIAAGGPGAGPSRRHLWRRRPRLAPRRAAAGRRPSWPARRSRPGLSFSDTASRFVAYLIDGLDLDPRCDPRRAVRLGRSTSPVHDGAGTFGQAIDVSLEYDRVGRRRRPVLHRLVVRWTPGDARIGLFRIQVGNAFDGKPLRLDQAARRWLAFGDFAQVFGIALPFRWPSPVSSLVERRVADHHGHQPDQTGPA